MTPRWNALVLAAGRGPDDPMAKAHGVARKCEVPVDGVAMLKRVAATLSSHRSISNVVVSIEKEITMREILGGVGALFVQSSQSAPASVLAAIGAGPAKYPLLVTTADHPLLTDAMIEHFLKEADSSNADLCVALARDRVILDAYPEAKRTFLKFGRDRVSGCNLYALRTEHALEAVKLWNSLDEARKQPWRLIAAFGPGALLRFAFGLLTLESAFELGSRKLGIVAKPILMPFAEAAIDIDKPADLELAEKILKARRDPGSP
jgi:GTP:adenosylcobinamide-phosphate guanylyltransferase